jgi:DNA-binding MarR family transcriptional regulator
MANQDDLILDHIGRYTISIRRIIEQLFFAGGSCGTTLNRLVEKQLVQRVAKTLNGNYSYYQLTPKGAKARGVPVNKAAPKSATALAQNLATLWFSTMGPQWRKRLTDEELNKLFGAPEGGNTAYVAQNGDQEDTTVFRLFVPGEETAVRRTYVRTLKKIASEALENKQLVRWIERGSYRFAVLVHSEVRREELERLLKAENFPNLRVEIEIAPTPSTLPAFLPDKEEL